jgi:fumarate hydratase class I
MTYLTLPLEEKTVKSLKVGEFVLLKGVIVTARDRAHKWLCDTFIEGTSTPSAGDLFIYGELKSLLQGGVLYHCGPVMMKKDNGWEVVAAGPTTSEREEPFEYAVMKHFKIGAVMGKGGMGEKTLQACMEIPSVYLHAIGGAAVIAARRILRVIEVYKPEFGMPEAMWVFEVENFPALVTMDANGSSLHDRVLRKSQGILKGLFSS